MILPYILAIIALISWGVSPIIYKPFIGNLTGICANALKNNFAAILGIFIGIGYIPLLTKLGESVILAVIIATIMNVILGDIFFLEAIKRGGVSIGTPVSYTFQVFVLIFSWLLLNEVPTSLSLLGTFFVVIGIFLTSYSLRDIKDKLMGAIYGLITAFIWGLGLTIYGMMLKEQLRPEIVVMIRGFVILAIYGPYTALVMRKYKVNTKSFVMLNLGGIFGILVGSLAYYYAIFLSGNIGVITVISSASPVIGFVGSQIIYKDEKTSNIPRLSYIGVVLVLVGIFLTSLGGV
ncbi:MAG TPA: DMT family transporter [Euryarchaeota archaeon]|nr:DMT family transporter [Euryarchaeota archaeon]